MKKIVVACCATLSLFLLTFFSGCGIYDKMDLEKVGSELSLLRTEVPDLSKIKEIIEADTSYFGTLEDASFDTFKINSEYVLDGEYVLRQEKTKINSIPLTSYIIVKPAEDKKDLLEEQIELYYKELFDEYSIKEDATEEVKEHLQDIMKQEYEGYIIYILSYNNEEVWKKIEEESHSLLFENTIEASIEDFGLNLDDITEFKAVIPNQNTSSSFYLIVRPKSGKADNIKKYMTQYLKDLDKKWSTYLPDEYTLVKNHMDTEVGSYLVYIVSKDNKLVLKTIKNAVIQKD